MRNPETLQVVYQPLVIPFFHRMLRTEISLLRLYLSIATFFLPQLRSLGDTETQCIPQCIQVMRYSAALSTTLLYTVILQRPLPLRQAARGCKQSPL
jgi:hypothetical protein